LESARQLPVVEDNGGGDEEEEEGDALEGGQLQAQEERSSL